MLRRVLLVQPSLQPPAGGNGLVHGSAEDAVAKIVAVMGNSASQAALRAYLGVRRKLFSTDRFIRTIREIVDGFDNG